ncbi:hypothetical protein ABES25_18400 [Bacillus gobiensis]|uniref:hypothetical protein n=1 Tax=Bacillus gobiensis TaxID=1441095 RepID=UPI003D1C3A09
MVDIDKEIFELYMEVKKVKKFKNMFLDSPFIKKEKVQEKKKIYSRFFGGLIRLSVCCFFLFKYLFIICFFLFKYLFGIEFPYSILASILASILLFLIITVLSINKAKDKLAKLAGYDRFHLLKKTVVYETFEKRLRSRKYTVNQIEKYLLPYLKSQNKDKQEGSYITFIKNQIPTIIVSIITSLFTVIINAAIREPNFNPKDLTGVMFTWIGLGVELILIGAAIFVSIHQFQNKRNHKLLETLFYNYLLENGQKPVKKYKKKT